MATDKTPNIKVIKGGKFELAEMIERNTYINEDGDQVVHLTPQLYDIMIDDKLCANTRSLTKKEIDGVCKFYKGRYMSFVDPTTVEQSVDEDGEVSVDDTEAEVIECDVHHMEYDSKECVFTIFAENAFRLTPLGLYPFAFRDEETNLIEIDIPQEYNNMLIECDDECGVLIDVPEFLETLRAHIETLAVEFNYENDCFDKIWKKLQKNANKMNGGAKKPRRSRKKNNEQ